MGTLALPGCAIGGDDTRTVTVQQAPSGGATTPSAEPAPAEAPPAEGAIAQAEGSVDGQRVRFVVTELRRSGPTVILNARVEPARISEGSTLGAQINDSFSDGEQRELSDGAQESNDVFDGVALIDPNGRKKYLVARDSQGQCVCSNQLSGEFVKENPVNLEATLSAPPAGVDRVDLIVPSIKTFSGVPISG